MSIVERQDMTISRSIVIQEDGKPDKRVAAMVGRVSPGKSIMISMSLRDKEKAQENREQVAEALGVFINDVKKLARESNIPI